jgi:phosphatidylethanolamine-binding protein (PEBP) family uncharacterized protein
MAQRTGADGLIGPKAKITSAGFVPALGLAVVLALSGCGGGGGSGDPQTASSSDSQASAEAKDSSQPSSSQQKQSSGGEGQSGEGEASPSPTSLPEVPASERKHGKRIVLPQGSPEPAPSSKELKEATIVDVSLTSPVLTGDTASSEALLPATYTCDGADSWPTLTWQGIPSGTEELDLFVMNAQPVDGKLFFDWAVAGIDPTLGQIEAAKLPKGATVGQNSFGKVAYSICPAKSEASTYVFALYALPQGLAVRRGFDPHQLREEVLDVSGNAGVMAASYARG